MPQRWQKLCGNGPFACGAAPRSWTLGAGFQDVSCLPQELDLGTAGFGVTPWHYTPHGAYPITKGRRGGDCPALPHAVQTPILWDPYIHLQWTT